MFKSLSALCRALHSVPFPSISRTKSKYCIDSTQGQSHRNCCLPRFASFYVVVYIRSVISTNVHILFHFPRAGHDLFSQEKPEAVIASQEKLQKELRQQRNQQ